MQEEIRRGTQEVQKFLIRGDMMILMEQGHGSVENPETGWALVV
jgi:hypothetical protein